MWLGRGSGIAPPRTSPRSGRHGVPFDFRSHPRYREQTPLDPLLNIQAGLDSFPAEKLHDQIAAILSEFAASLLNSPRNTQLLQQILASDFRGVSLRPVETKVLRPGPALEIRHLRFAAETALGPEAFADEFGAALADFASLITAEFQIIGIAVLPSGNIQTQLRYELVGTGSNFYREQRSGAWDLVWNSGPGSA